jgi:hypothetical protein
MIDPVQLFEELEKLPRFVILCQEYEGRKSEDGKTWSGRPPMLHEEVRWQDVQDALLKVRVENP